MKFKLSVIAVLTLSSQLVFATDPALEAASPQKAVSTPTSQPEDDAVSSNQARSLQRDLTPSLQNKLDDQMEFEFVPQLRSRDEVAGLH